MRSALAFAFVTLLAPSALAQATPLSVELRAPPELHAGDRAEIVALVRGAGAHPLLVTPASEGTALEVVRGRLLRADAIDPRAEVLELRIPIVASSPGTSVVRVSAAGYACAERCRLVRAEASVVVRVGAALTGRRKKQDAPEAAEEEAEPSRERTSSLSWVRMPGAEACVSSAALARAIEERLARRVFVSAAEADLAVEGRAERTESGWRAVLVVSDASGATLGERTLESAETECEELGRLVALTVAIMIDPLTAPETPEEPEREPEVIVREVHVPVPVPMPAPTRTPGPRWRVEIDTAIAGTIGLLPTAALGGVATVIVEPPNFIPLAIEGALVPWARAENMDGYADFLHVHAGLQICPLAIREQGLALHACIGADAGAVFVLDDSGVVIEETERVIGQAHAVVRGHWDVVSILTIRLAVHLLVPFRHEPFTYGGGASQLYAPEPVAGMLDLGAGIHFD